MTIQFQVLNKQGQPIFSDVNLHPGEVIDMELEARGIKKNFFALQLNIKPSQLSELLHGKRHVNAVLAIKLEKLLGIEAEYWQRVQSAYDLAVARRELAAA
jgi:addiction module HigA family antidote